MLGVGYDPATDRQHVLVMHRDGSWRDLASSKLLALMFPSVSIDGKQVAVTGQTSIDAWVYAPLEEVRQSP